METLSAFNWYASRLEDYNNRRDFYRRQGFKPPTIHSRDWEVFGSILLNDLGQKGNGSDLLNHEVKSAQKGNGFEYQYCRKSGIEKWKKDIAIQHLLVSYDCEYRDVKARLLPAYFAEYLMYGWLEKIKTAYHTKDVKQRCRESISYDQATDYGEVVFEVKDGKLVLSVDRAKFSSEPCTSSPVTAVCSDRRHAAA